MIVGSESQIASGVVFFVLYQFITEMGCGCNYTNNIILTPQADKAFQPSPGAAIGSLWPTIGICLEILG